MMCSGKVLCDIYRDKKYCRKDGRESNSKQCNCTHAVLTCEVEECAFADRCMIWQHFNKEELK